MGYSARLRVRYTDTTHHRTLCFLRICKWVSHTVDDEFAIPPRVAGRADPVLRVFWGRIVNEAFTIGAGIAAVVAAICVVVEARI